MKLSSFFFCALKSVGFIGVLGWAIYCKYGAVRGAGLSAGGSASRFASHTLDHQTRHERDIHSREGVYYTYSALDVQITMSSVNILCDIFLYLNQSLCCVHTMNRFHVSICWNRLAETIPTYGHNIGIFWEIRKLHLKNAKQKRISFLLIRPTWGVSCQ